jgi:hypothetical protein
MYRENKPEGFYYLDHRTVDIKYNIITDTFVTPGNINDVDPYINRLDRQKERFGFEIKYVGLDAGYYTNPICKYLSDRKIQGVIGYRSGVHQKGKYSKNKFQYDQQTNTYTCPNGGHLRYKTTTSSGYSEYVSEKSACENCTHKDKCLPEKSSFKTLRRHVWEEHKESIKEFMKSEKGKGIYKKRKETVERSFADSKQLHGLRYCRMRGKSKVSEQCLLTAASQNIKKIALVLSRKLSFIFSINILIFKPKTQKKTSLGRLKPSYFEKYGGL